jgi:hypothetical protein
MAGFFLGDTSRGNKKGPLARAFISFSNGLRDALPSDLTYRRDLTSCRS